MSMSSTGVGNVVRLGKDDDGHLGARTSQHIVPRGCGIEVTNVTVYEGHVPLI